MRKRLQYDYKKAITTGAIQFTADEIAEYRYVEEYIIDITKDKKEKHCWGLMKKVGSENNAG